MEVNGTQKAISTKINKRLNSKEIQQTIWLLKSKMPQSSIQEIINSMHSRLQMNKIQNKDTSKQAQNQAKYLDKLLGQQMSSPAKPQKRKRQCKPKVSYRTIRDRQKEELRYLQQQNDKQKNDILSQCKTQCILNTAFAQQNNAQLLWSQVMTQSDDQALKEKVILYREQETSKTIFLNIQEEKRYSEFKLLAKSFIERGYGVTNHRRQIQYQGLAQTIHRNKYKNIASGLMILAFRKMQEFVEKEGRKTIKKLNRCQMRRIAVILLNYRENLQPQHYRTFFKFIKVGFAMGDLEIGVTQSLNLYVAILKFLHGKATTMEDLQRIGRIYQKQQRNLTLAHLNRKNKKISHRRDKARRKEEQNRNQAKLYNKGYNTQQQLFQELSLSDEELLLDDSEESLGLKNEEQLSKEKKNPCNLIKGRPPKDSIPIIPASFLQFPLENINNNNQQIKTLLQQLNIPQLIIYNQQSHQFSLIKRQQ